MSSDHPRGGGKWVCPLSSSELKSIDHPLASNVRDLVHWSIVKVVMFLLRLCLLLCSHPGRHKQLKGDLMATTQEVDVVVSVVVYELSNGINGTRCRKNLSAWTLLGRYC